MALVPIRLGSAAGSYLVFESSSNIETSESGIQSVNVKALWGDGSTVFTKIPAAGTSFSTIFGHAYLPSDFKVNRSENDSIGVEYLDGRVARVTFNFKRPDPALTQGPNGTSRQVFVDSVINYQSPQTQVTLTLTTPSGSGSSNQFVPFGFPEPVVTVKYNSPTQPGIGAGSLAQLHALPGSANAQGFPTTPAIQNPVSVPLPAGATVVYFNGTAYVQTGPLAAATVFNFIMEYRADPLGWQLIRLKSDPLAGATVWDVEEQWRTYYFLYALILQGTVPPI